MAVIIISSNKFHIIASVTKHGYVRRQLDLWSLDQGFYKINVEKTSKRFAIFFQVICRVASPYFLKEESNAAIKD